MSTPIIEYIVEDIKDAIDAITIANGFNQTLTAIRPKRSDFKDVTPKDGDVLIWQADELESAAESFGTEDWTQPFVLEAVVLDSDTSETSIDTRLNQVRADIQKKLREDITRGGYAYDTLLRPSAKFDDGEGFSGIAVLIEVRYRVREADPYTKA